MEGTSRDEQMDNRRNTYPVCPVSLLLGHVIFFNSYNNPVKEILSQFKRRGNRLREGFHLLRVTELVDGSAEIQTQAILFQES